MTDFATLGDNNNIPYTQGTAEDNALGLSNPDSVLSGTNRGTQNLGSRNIRSEPENTRIVVDDNTTNRVSFGKIGTGVNDWGLKVSKPTYNVDTATSDQLIFNSSQNVFKIIQSSTTAIPAVTLGVSDTVWNSVVIPHNLPYIPVVQAYGRTPSYVLGYFPGVATFANAYVSLPYTPPVMNTNVSLNTIICGVDATNVYFSYFYQTNASGGFTFAQIPIRYYLLQETAN